MVVPLLHGAKQTLSLRGLPGLSRYINVQTGRDFMRYAFKSTYVPYLQRPPLQPSQSQQAGVLACPAAVGQEASRAEDVFHTPVLLSEVLDAFSDVNLKVHGSESAYTEFS